MTKHLKSFSSSTKIHYKIAILAEEYSQVFCHLLKWKLFYNFNKWKSLALKSLKNYKNIFSSHPSPPPTLFLLLYTISFCFSIVHPFMLTFCYHLLLFFIFSLYLFIDKFWVEMKDFGLICSCRLLSSVSFDIKLKLKERAEGKVL